MAVKKINKQEQITANTPDSILLTITIGNAQIGGSVVRWKNSQEIIGKGEIKNLNLGTGTTLKGRVLKVTTNVLDVNEQTNGIIINDYFYNSGKPLFTFEDRVNNDGDILQLITEYNFK